MLITQYTIIAGVQYVIQIMNDINMLILTYSAILVTAYCTRCYIGVQKIRVVWYECMMVIHLSWGTEINVESIQCPHVIKPDKEVYFRMRLLRFTMLIIAQGIKNE